ncbi:hypothetical protein SAMN04488107_4032 [Geodermatophilus saharensis]|uniref:Uncharacterized protein n=1 Tax=Geodermatophilus saharensis TaxID=1137994 RepID=A0A239HV47_9ACTN|nr:hypothetical protein [Geodermatophilus saharensis]SNS85122.1 hypothetical protein SAMN04488107_4032 [Geodermatophilus saharensis]
MPFHYFTDADRQAMRDAAEEIRVYWDLVDRYTVWREPDDGPVTRGQLEIMGGLRKIDPNRRK